MLVHINFAVLIFSYFLLSVVKTRLKELSAISLVRCCRAYPVPGSNHRAAGKKRWIGAMQGKQFNNLWTLKNALPGREAEGSWKIVSTWMWWELWLNRDTCFGMEGFAGGASFLQQAAELAQGSGAHVTGGVRLKPSRCILKPFITSKGEQQIWHSRNSEQDSFSFGWYKTLQCHYDSQPLKT